MVNRGTMKNGLYSIHVSLQDGRSGKGSGVVVFRDGKILGGDAYLFYIGTYTAKGDTFKGEVLIYGHKESELADVEQRYPSDHYVVVDDKLRILHAIKQVWESRVTTVFVSQGNYAKDPETIAKYPAADLSVERIGDLLNYDSSDFGLNS